MVTAIVVILYACVVVFDLVPLFKKGQKKEGWIYTVCFAVTFCVLILHTLGISVPSPAPLIEKTIRALLGQGAV